MASDARCETCRWWAKGKPEIMFGHGVSKKQNTFCCRFPKREWKDADDWCGEWEERDDEG